MSLRPSGAVAAVLLTLTLGACEVPPPQQALPQLTFAHLQPYRFDVGTVEIVDQYQAPMRDPNVEHVMPLPPAAAVKRWAQDRLQPMGTTGAVRVIIRDASVVEVPLKTDTGLAGLFKQQQAERYDANLELALQVLDERKLAQAEITARSQRSRTMPEGVTLNERDRIWFGMVEDMMQDLNAQLDRLIPQYFGSSLMR